MSLLNLFVWFECFNLSTTVTVQPKPFHKFKFKCIHWIRNKIIESEIPVSIWIYLSGFRMALTNAEKQKQWRERQKERNPEQFKRKRVKYIPGITELSADKQTQERQKGKEKYLQKCHRREEYNDQLDVIESQPSTSGTSLRQNDCEKLIQRRSMIQHWSEHTEKSKNWKRRTGK